MEKRELRAVAHLPAYMKPVKKKKSQLSIVLKILSSLNPTNFYISNILKLPILGVLQDREFYENHYLQTESGPSGARPHS